MVARQPNLDGLLVEEGGREALDALPQHGAGDALRVDLIGLPRLRVLHGAKRPSASARHAGHARLR